MALPLPEHFDWNEWYILIGLVLGYTVIFPIRERIPAPIFVLVLFFGITSFKILDVVVGFDPFNLYDLNDKPQLELMDVLLHFLYAPFSYMFVYVYDRWHIHGLAVVLYVLVCL